MTKPTSTTKKPRKQHTPEFRQEALKLAERIGVAAAARSLYTILCKCLFSEVTVEAVTELDDKTAHCHAPVPQRHRPFL